MQGVPCDCCVSAEMGLLRIRGQVGAASCRAAGKYVVVMVRVRVRSGLILLPTVGREQVLFAGKLLLAPGAGRVALHPPSMQEQLLSGWAT